MIKLTDEDAELIGRTFRNMVRGRNYETVTEILRQQYREQLMATAPGQSDEREQLYQEARAMEAFLGTIETFVVIAEQKALNAEQDDFNLTE